MDRKGHGGKKAESGSTGRFRAGAGTIARIAANAASTAVSSATTSPTSSGAQKAAQYNSLRSGFADQVVFRICPGSLERRIVNDSNFGRPGPQLLTLIVR